MGHSAAAPGFCKGPVVGPPCDLMRILGYVLVYVIDHLGIDAMRRAQPWMRLE